VSLPEWGIDIITAKIDTGALTSSIHIEGLEELGGSRIRFDVVLSLAQKHRRVTVEEECLRMRRVRSSNGEVTIRPLVETLLRIGPIEKPIQLTLIGREMMKSRMLIGRQALSNDFAVLCDQAFLAGAPLEES
jgi:hypothetical protein